MWCTRFPGRPSGVIRRNCLALTYGELYPSAPSNGYLLLPSAPRLALTFFFLIFDPYCWDEEISTPDRGQQRGCTRLAWPSRRPGRPSGVIRRNWGRSLPRAYAVCGTLVASQGGFCEVFDGVLSDPPALLRGVAAEMAQLQTACDAHNVVCDNRLPRTNEP